MTLDTPPKFTAGELNVYRNPADVAAVTRVLRATGRRVALVPTMGALHEGHVSLVKRAVSENEVVAVSLFVNPTQFNDKNDLKNYPRTPEKDLALLE